MFVGLSVSGAVAIGGLFLLVSSPVSAVAVALTANSSRRRKVVSSASAAAAAAFLFFVGWCIRRCEDSNRGTLRDMMSPDRNETLKRLGLDIRMAEAEQETEFNAAIHLANAPPDLATGWLPLLAACLAILVSNAGFGTLVWATITDLIPQRYNQFT